MQPFTNSFFIQIQNVVGFSNISYPKKLEEFYQISVTQISQAESESVLERLKQRYPSDSLLIEQAYRAEFQKKSETSEIEIVTEDPYGNQIVSHSVKESSNFISIFLIKVENFVLFLIKNFF